MYSSRAQGAVEAIITLGLLTIFITISITPFVIRIVSYKEARQFIDAGYICNRIYSTMSSTLTSGKDFNQIIELPEKIGDDNYNLSVYPDAMYVIISVPENNILCALQSRSIINAANSSEPFNLTSKRLSFRNLNTVVMIEEL